MCEFFLKFQVDEDNLTETNGNVSKSLLSGTLKNLRLPDDILIGYPDSIVVNARHFHPEFCTE